MLQGAEVNEIVDTGEYFFSLLEIEISYNTLGSVSDYLDDDTFIVDTRVLVAWHLARFIGSIEYPALNRNGCYTLVIDSTSAHTVYQFSIQPSRSGACFHRVSNTRR